MVLPRHRFRPTFLTKYKSGRGGFPCRFLHERNIPSIGGSLLFYSDFQFFIHTVLSINPNLASTFAYCLNHTLGSYFCNLLVAAFVADATVEQGWLIVAEYALRLDLCLLALAHGIGQGVFLVADTLDCNRLFNAVTLAGCGYMNIGRNSNYLFLPFTIL